ncbi:MBG-2 domain-containing protein, partial [Pedobacter hiemivivus]|uniref:MBG-2 domain-containing protein n=1 Tax=Pedobacter hiemivivus TaxID=2530454 RepID=UPI00146A7935
SLTYTGANLSIGKQTIAVVAVAKNKTYGDVDPSLTYTFTPVLVTGDSFTGDISRALGESIGNYPISQGSLALNNNYVLTYTGSSLSIDKKTIAVGAVAKSKTYGDIDPALSYTFTPALATGDSFTGDISRALGESIGNYPISQGSLALNNNYILTYTGANLSIDKQTIAVVAVAKNKTYGQADPALIYTFTPALVAGDSFTGDISRALGENIGDYAIEQGTLALNSNYTLNYTGADLVIGKKTIAVVAIAKNKTYGQADPALTYTFTPALVTGDSFTGDISRAAGENIGNYAIGLGTLALNSNYSLTYTSADLSIGKQTIAVAAVAKSKTYGDVDPALTYTFTPALVTGDSFTGDISRAAGENIGNYTIGLGTLALNSNYSLTYTGANLSIGKQTIAVVAVAKNKTYGDVDPSLTYTFTPVLVTGDSFTGDISRALGESIGNYPISQGSLALNNNYVLT